MKENIEKLKRALQEISEMKQTYERRKEKIGVSVDDSSIDELKRIEKNIWEIISKIEGMGDLKDKNNAKELTEQITLAVDGYKNELGKMFTRNMLGKYLDLRKEFIKEEYDREMEEEKERGAQTPTLRSILFKLEPPYPSTVYWYRYHSLAALKEMVDYESFSVPKTSTEDVIKRLIGIKMTNKKFKSVREARRIIDAVLEDGSIVSDKKYMELEEYVKSHKEDYLIEVEFPRTATPTFDGNKAACAWYNNYKQKLKNVKSNANRYNNMGKPFPNQTRFNTDIVTNLRKLSEITVNEEEKTRDEREDREEH